MRWFRRLSNYVPPPLGDAPFYLPLSDEEIEALSSGDSVQAMARLRTMSFPDEVPLTTAMRSDPWEMGATGAAPLLTPTQLKQLLSIPNEYLISGAFQAFEDLRRTKIPDAGTAPKPAPEPPEPVPPPTFPQVRRIRQLADDSE